VSRSNGSADPAQEAKSRTGTTGGFEDRIAGVSALKVLTVAIKPTLEHIRNRWGFGVQYPFAAMKEEGSQHARKEER